MDNFYTKIAELQSKGQDLIIVTVTEKEGMSPSDVGKKMIVTRDGQSFGTIGGGSIEHFAIEKCKDLFKSRLSLSEKYVLMDKEVKVASDEIKLNMACGGKATLFYEFVGPKQYVYIFGAGHCGAALSKLLRPLNFYVTVIDDRKEVMDKLDDSPNKKELVSFAKYVEDNASKLNNSFIVVASPSHTYDYEILDKVFELGIKPKYFGMLCSKKKIADYLKKLTSKYGKVDLSNFYSPIGLATGGDSPEEVAISIASEILSVHYQKNVDGSHMRDHLPNKYF